MHRILRNRFLLKAHRNAPGFTLVEVLVAIMILTVALLGIGGVIAVQNNSGIAASLSFGQAAVSRGYYISTATMLAQDRMEQVKRVPYNVGSADPFGADPNAAPPGLGDENPVNGYPNYIRQVRITPAAAGAVAAGATKTVTVTITFTLPKETGTAQESIALNTIIAARP
jgi:prepilin-type N-terminal cleavage/methylation domain-containing protein